MTQTQSGFHDDCSDKCSDGFQADDRNHLKLKKLHIASDFEPRDAFDQAYGTLYHNKSGWHDLLGLNNGASWAFHKSLIGQ